MTTESTSTESALRAAKRPRSILAGPYGHPFHGILVTIPIGTWVASLVFDIVGAASGQWEIFATGAQWLIGIGIVGALVAAVVGFLDFTKLTPQTRARRIATIHMTLNLTVVVLFAIGFAVRAAAPGQPSVVGIVISVVALLCLSISGALGGELAYRYGVRVADEQTQRAGYRP
jgi:uncharacterized membrane protein